MNNMEDKVMMIKGGKRVDSKTAKLDNIKSGINYVEGLIERQQIDKAKEMLEYVSYNLNLIKKGE